MSMTSVGAVEDIYSALTFALNCKVVIELGTGSGISTRAFLNALRHTGGILYSVDLFPQNEPIRTTLTQFKDEKQVVFIAGDSIEVGKQWNKGPVDIVLCDSDHAKERVMGELDVWDQYKPKIFLIHDVIYLTPESHLAPPYDACLEWATKHNRKFVYLHIPVTPSLGMII